MAARQTTKKALKLEPKKLKSKGVRTLKEKGVKQITKGAKLKKK